MAFMTCKICRFVLCSTLHINTEVPWDPCLGCVSGLSMPWKLRFCRIHLWSLCRGFIAPKGHDFYWGIPTLRSSKALSNVPVPIKLKHTRRWYASSFFVPPPPTRAAHHREWYQTRNKPRVYSSPTPPGCWFKFLLSLCGFTLRQIRNGARPAGSDIKGSMIRNGYQGEYVSPSSKAQKRAKLHYRGFGGAQSEKQLTLKSKNYSLIRLNKWDWTRSLCSFKAFRGLSFDELMLKTLME